jgi:hypothetical protein
MLRRLVLVIAAITIVTGLAQILWARPMLELVGAHADATAGHLFATVGMFMAIIGAAVWRAERVPSADASMLLWGTLQKALASALVAVGVARHVFADRALIVAAFDGLSAVVFAAHLMTRSR